MEFFEVTGTQRAMRRLKPDAISDAGSLDDPRNGDQSAERRQPAAVELHRRARRREETSDRRLVPRGVGARVRRRDERGDARRPDAARARIGSADHLARHLAEAPVLIIAVIRKDQFAIGPTLGASIYPAVQNLMLAARALGLGTTLTTLHKLHEDDVKQLLGIPDNVETMALIPLGVPQGRFGPPTRMPVEKVVYWDGWGTTHDRQ